MSSFLSWLDAHIPELQFFALLVMIGLYLFGIFLEEDWKDPS